MDLLRKIFLSTLVSVLMTVIVTAALEERIFFSAFVGIPAGIIAFLAVFAYLSLKKDK
ncbi:hypothetical protein [Methanomethylovorans sp.]|uniref:hypothetical protein n=1 Tax=Methanomethylovorans sp. TaxID=2758717 RepID=UPI00351C5A15